MAKGVTPSKPCPFEDIFVRYQEHCVINMCVSFEGHSFFTRSQIEVPKIYS